MSAKETNSLMSGDEVITIPLDLIDANPRNKQLFSMRNIDTLAKNIADNGLIEHPIVRKKEDGRYELIAGERRITAIRSLKSYSEIPCVVRQVDDPNIAIKTLIDSNIHSRKLTPLEMARCISEYKSILQKEHSVIKKTQSKQEKKEQKDKYGTFNVFDVLSDKFGLNKSSLRRYDAIMNLIPELQELTDDSEFPYYALQPVSAFSADEQKEFYKNLMILIRDMSGEPDGESEGKYNISRKHIEYVLNNMDLKNKREARSSSSGSSDKNTELFASDPEVFSDDYDNGSDSDIKIIPSVESLDFPLSAEISAPSLPENFGDDETNVKNETELFIDSMIAKVMVNIQSITIDRRRTTYKSDVKDKIKEIRNYLDEIEKKL